MSTLPVSWPGVTSSRPGHAYRDAVAAPALGANAVAACAAARSRRPIGTGRARRARYYAERRTEGRPMPNWAEQVTAIATAVGAVGLVSAIGAVIFAGRQAREARIGRQAEMAVEFFRRWSEGPMLETRRLVAEFETPEALRDALTGFIPEN